MDETRINEAIAKIESLAAENIPTIIWIYTSAGEGGTFHIRHSETRGAVFPEHQVRLNLTFEETEELSRRLSIRPDYSFIEKRSGGLYQEYQWWSPTSISGAAWHDTTWTDECVGAGSSFIITGLPLGAYEDLQVALKLAKESLAKFSCKNVDALTKDEMCEVIVESSIELCYIKALLEKMGALGSPLYEISPMKYTFRCKKLERLIEHEIPWRFAMGHIDDVRIYINEAIKICGLNQVDLPQKALGHISVYGDIIISFYESALKRGDDPFQNYFILNDKECAETGVRIANERMELKNFIELTGDNELLRRFNLVDTQLVAHWNEKFEKFHSLRSRIGRFIRNILSI